jgi:hypothetical protein
MYFLGTPHACQYTSQITKFRLIFPGMGHHDPSFIHLPALIRLSTAAK